MKVKSLAKALVHLDPLFIYIVMAYGLGRVYQYVYDVESVWQTFWNRLQEALGKANQIFMKWISEDLFAERLQSLWGI